MRQTAEKVRAIEPITRTDLDQWSVRIEATGLLPSLVRQLLMATGPPGIVRVPAAEGVRAPGFDGWVATESAFGPYVPAGQSVWEFGTGGNPGKKATDDYTKRTREIPAVERATLTYVAVTSRVWPPPGEAHRQGPDRWVARRRAREEWADVRALHAEDLATWLETLPSVAAWMAERLGRDPGGAISMRDKLADYCETTNPPVPPALLLAGRDSACQRLRDQVATGRGVATVRGATRDEATAFIGAALLADPQPRTQPTGKSPRERPIRTRPERRIPRPPPLQFAKRFWPAPWWSRPGRRGRSWQAGRHSWCSSPNSTRCPTPRTPCGPGTA